MPSNPFSRLVCLRYMFSLSLLLSRVKIFLPADRKRGELASSNCVCMEIFAAISTPQICHVYTQNFIMRITTASKLFILPSLRASVKSATEIKKYFLGVARKIARNRSDDSCRFEFSFEERCALPSSQPCHLSCRVNSARFVSFSSFIQETHFYSSE